MRGRRRVGFVLALIVLSTALAGGVVAATQSSDEAALAADARRRRAGASSAQVDALLRKMTLEEKLQQLQLLSDGQITTDEATSRSAASSA